MSDRLSELQRQRDLLREHLAWIEREIATEAGVERPSPLPLQPVVTTPVYRAPLDPHEADAILAQYSQPPASIATRTKAGCILYFVVSLAFLAVTGTVVYYLMTRARGR